MNLLDDINRNEYLKRIRYKGKLDTSVEVLQNLQKAHLFNVPFENLDIHYGNVINLGINNLFEKIVTNKRGGFCYELNGLYYELLKSIGFDTKRISARVYNKEKGYGEEFDHMAIIVNINGVEYLTDVGFGEFSIVPLKLELGISQNDTRSVFVMDKFKEEYLRVNKVIDDEFIHEYIFKNIERKLDDYNNMCTYHQTSPNSHFTQKRLITRPTDNGRITISGNELKIRDNESVKRIVLNNETEFKNQLWKYFKIKIENIISMKTQRSQKN